MVIVGYYAHGNKHYVAFKDETDAKDRFMITDGFHDRPVTGRNQENSADFIQCVAFGKAAEFAERYLHKGTKIVLTGRIQTGSYTNKDGQRVYTTDIVAEDQEFAESKNAESGNAGGYNTQPAPAPQSGNDGFMPAGDDSELPFV